MHVVHHDFRRWFFAYHLGTRLDEQKPNVLCLLGGEPSVYIEEVLSKYPELRILDDPSALSSSDGERKALALLGPMPSDRLKQALETAQSTKTDVWDIASEYADYEAERLPQDYVLNEFHYRTESELATYTARRDAISEGYIRRYICKCYDGMQKVLFNKLEIETINRCNGRCAFCPVNCTRDPRPFRLMDEKLFSNILEQLQALSYSGALALFSNNEPLMDGRLPTFLQLARKSLPNAFIYIYTNGTLLREELLNELFPYLDWIHVDCYTDKPELPKNMDHLRQTCWQRKIPPEKISFHLRNRKELLTTRAGTAPNRGSPLPVHSLCPLPFSQMVIRPDGKVSQCCNDALGQATLGDLTKQSLEDVWYGKALETLRAAMLDGGRQACCLCRGCDTIFTSLPYEERNV